MSFMVLVLKEERDTRKNGGEKREKKENEAEIIVLTLPRVKLFTWHPMCHLMCIFNRTIHLGVKIWLNYLKLMV